MGDKFKMGQGLGHQLEMALERTGWTEEKVNELTKGDFLARVRQVVDGLAEIVVPKLLKLLRTVSVPACRKFSARSTFGAPKPAIKLWYLGDNFKKNFLPKVEKNIPATELTVSELTMTSVDGPILAELGSKAETSLFHFWYLLSQQPNGEPGVLLTNGYTNIFYIKDVNDTRWAVRADWYTVHGWRVIADSVGGPDGWGAGNQVFSR